MAKAQSPADDLETDAALAAQFRRQIRFWTITAIVIALLLYMFSDILLPFVAGMVLAYFLDPVADRLQRIGLSRVMATVLILFSFIVVLTLALVIVIPIVVTQLSDFIGRLPQYLSRLQGLVTGIDPQWLEKTFGVNAAALREGLNSLLTEGFGFMTTIFELIWASGLALFNIAGLFVVTPVVAFYMLLDWDRMVAKVDSWVPREHVATVRAIASDINTSSAGFVRGQGTLVAGARHLLCDRPDHHRPQFRHPDRPVRRADQLHPLCRLAGRAGACRSGLAIIQFWPDYFMIGAVALVFIVGQFIEGNILHPLLVGKSVGLHPVWLMFALFAFGALFGFVGLLIAVPAAAAVAVLVRFALNRYLESPLYRGHADDPPVVVEKPRARAARASSKSDARGR